MGGHGALTLYLSSLHKGIKQYRSVSAFAPISNPINCPWGQKAFNGYLQGGIEEAKERYDATELIKTAKFPVNILVDYVSQLLKPSVHSILISLFTNRVLVTTFTNKGNFFPRIS